MTRWIAKEDGWFKTGTECELLCQYGDGAGLFRGIRVCSSDPPYERKLWEPGEERLDEEGCGFDEFRRVEE